MVNNSKTPPNNRPNKTAKGTTKTLYRSPKNVQIRNGKRTTNRLSLYGTLDSLRGMYWFCEKVPTAPCGCKCPHNGLQLNDAGRRRLADLRTNRKVYRIEIGPASTFSRYERRTAHIQDDALLDNLIEYPAKLRELARAIGREAENAKQTDITR